MGKGGAHRGDYICPITSHLQVGPHTVPAHRPAPCPHDPALDSQRLVAPVLEI